MSEDCHLCIILVLNFCTGGIGTIISPFLFKDSYNCRNILSGILIGIIQILNFVHLLSIIFKFQFIDNFYDIIGGENVLKPFMSEQYKIFINTTNEIKETLDDYLFESEINPDEILSKDSRITFLKVILGTISSMSYINSNLAPFLNLINKSKPDFKTVTYGIFNPGAGLLISGILFFNKEYGYIIISSIGVLFGILLMLSPFILGIGLYLLKILNNILNLFFVKFLFIYFGAVGTIFSLIFSILQKDMNNDDVIDIQKNQYDIYCEICSDHKKIKSNFGIKTIIRIICNIFIPGSGIFSLLCKFECHVGIILIGISQVVSGLYLYMIALSLLLNKLDKDYISLSIFLTYCLSDYLAGTLIIFISEYFEKMPKEYDGFAIFPLTILNLLTGGYGNSITIFNSNNCFCENKFGNCIAIFFKIIWCIIGNYLQFMVVFIIFAGGDTGVIVAFSVVYSLYIILSFIFHCVGRKKENGPSFYYSIVIVVTLIVQGI